MMRFWKEHQRIGGAIFGFAVALAAVLVIYLIRDRRDRTSSKAPPAISEQARPPAPVDEHAGHGAAPTTYEHAGQVTPTADEHADHGAPAATASEVPQGYAPVALDDAQASAMGLTSAVIGERDFARALRTVGVVAVDETRTAHIHTRVRGWIEDYYVQYVGRRVRAGQALVSIYSQEAYAAQLELASLLKSPVRSPELLDAARQRLALWDIPKSVIAKVEQTGEAQRTFPVLSPRSGVVVAKQAFAGLFVDPSLELYTISDLSRVWVFADIYEADVPFVKVGTSARLTIEGRPEPLTAKVTFLAPTIDETTRTRKARFEVANKDNSLLPGAFVTVELELAIGRGLAVPESAVIRTGERSIVFVLHPVGRSESGLLPPGGTHAAPREVKLGPLVGDHYRVDAGLAAGERVATGAQFLLDSESRLRASAGTGGGHAGH
jgi:membrane fusion protein, copper/silver efflux system